MKGNTQLRQESIRQTLSQIKYSGPISKRELQDKTGFSWGKISFVSNLLLNENYVMTVGKQDTFVGRKPDELDININDNYIIGVDFSCEGVLVAVCDLKGRVINKYFNEFEQHNYDTALNTLFSLVQKALYDNPQKNIICISVAMQGEVDVENGVAKLIRVIEGWQNVPVCDLLFERFKIPALLLHDPDCLLYTERFYGALKDDEIENSALIRMDHHGIGIAAVIDGEMFTGVGKRRCEIGTVAVPDDKGGQTLLYNILSEKYIQKEFYYMTNEELSCDEIADLARQGDAEAKLIFRRQATALGFAFNSLISLLNSEKIVIFGEFCKYLDLILPEAQKVVYDLQYGYVPKIVLSELQNDAAAVGAALCASDRVIMGLEFPEN